MQQTDLSSDFFSLFGLPVSFDIDTTALTARYRELQRAVHPDKFVNASDSERRLSMQVAARVNEGYQLLKDPLARGRYLLEMRGVELNDADTTVDKMFLMEQMELRERLAEVKESNSPDRELQGIKQEIAIHTKEITEQMGAMLQNEDPEVLQQAIELTRKLQFFKRLKEEVEELEESLVEL